MANQSILIVDDEPLLLKALARTIRLAGHHVHTAARQDSALELCEAHSFDVVILDFIMPGVNGLELLARIRKLQPNVKSIVVSGKLDPNIDEKQITTQLREQVEADIYLHKPVAGNRILDAINALTDKESSTDWKKLASGMISPGKQSIKGARQAASALPKRKQGK